MSELYKNKYRIESTRRKNWDYSQEGFYFITICTRDRINVFGNIQDGEMINTKQADICNECWMDLPNHYPNIELDEFIIMPDHIHGIVVITDSVCVNQHDVETIRPHVETIHELSLRNDSYHRDDSRINDDQFIRQQRRSMLIPKIIGRFKMQSAKKINQFQNTIGQPFWQKNYHDRIIRDETELYFVREYIRNNPLHYTGDIVEQNDFVVVETIQPHVETIHELSLPIYNESSLQYDKTNQIHQRNQP
ncbi:MAG: transposase [Leptospiraceae bacterium]|nr:transposase [Leptospiraceae bacterium]